MNFWKIKMHYHDASIIYFDVHHDYIAIEICGYMIGIDF